MEQISKLVNNLIHHQKTASTDKDIIQNDHKSLSVAQYLKLRLEQLKVTRLFGVPGNYTAPFLNTILEDSNSPIKMVTMQNELIAGYAADAYARIQGNNGIGVVHVTYGVGAFVLTNATAGSYAEKVPVIVINGAPTNKEFRTNRDVGLVYKHMLDCNMQNMNVFRNFTVAAVKITNAQEASLQIDSAITACLLHKLPVYIEVTQDVWRSQTHVPHNLPPLQIQDKLNYGAARDDVKNAVSQTIILIKDFLKEQKNPPIFWAGVEVQRYDLQQEFLDLLVVSGYKYKTTALSKSVLAENNIYYDGTGSIIDDDKQLDIILGALTTGADTNEMNIKGGKYKILLFEGAAFVGSQYFGNVEIKGFMLELKRQIQESYSHHALVYNKPCE